MSGTMYFIFGFTYLGLALGKIPGLRIDRAGIALVGTAACLAFGTLSLEKSAHAVDYRTLVLLFGMMVIAAHLRISGFFELLTRIMAKRFHRPKAMLAAVIVLSGVLSAFLVNDVVCVALCPLVLGLCQRLGRRPVPYLIGLATASNVGSVATITGNPQNMIIGSLSGIPYLQFAAKLAPIATIGLIINFFWISWIYRVDLSESKIPHSTASSHRLPASSPIMHPRLLSKSVAVTLGVVAAFFLGKPIAVAAMIGAAILLLDRIRPEKVYQLIDWPLLLMFSGLFIVVAGFEIHVVKNWGIENWSSIQTSPVILVSLVSAALSNLVSNVPAVLLFKPIVPLINDPQKAWLALAMSSTLAGNLTLLGSVANLIVVENAKRAGVTIRFLEYLKTGLPLTFVTLLVGMAWLYFV